MSKKKNKLIPKEGHRLVTRRDFLSQGLIESAGVIMMPSLIDMVLSPNFAHGFECATVDINNLNNPHVPFIEIDCSGGANLPHAFTPRIGDAGGNPIGSGGNRGISSNASQTLFGIPMNATQGGNGNEILRGILEQTSATTQANTKAAVICGESQNDTSSNRLGPTQLIAAAGLQGTLISSIVGSSSRVSGGRHDIPAMGGTLSPLRVRNPSDIVGAVSVGGALVSLSPGQKESVMRAVSNLSASQQAKLSGMTLADQFKELSNCGFTQNVAFAASAEELIARVDPDNNPLVAAVYSAPINNRESGNSLARRAAIVYNALTGATGPAVFEIGNCDYHDNGRTNTNSKDLEIGGNIGRVLELAQRMGKEVMLAVTTDGGISADGPDFASDSRSGSLSVMFHFKPNGVPVQRNGGQIGAYTSGQNVDRNSYVGRVVERTPYTMLLNWLSINGLEAMMPSLVSTNLFDPAMYSRLTIFKKS